ncbi:DUF5714 domain-containing protein [Thomasclavelia spiroformis]|uniref:DUF5714 domain-containing protein n=1 Tax=Thomasclavelia spiroformis TaxID=29348 RepID=UPI00241C5AD4|nr:DUF5714 domain-containing protein [Thomasclavelia spiroformis]MBS6114553.1 hypothetical protein [Thomasclavelia spiroformis]
MTSFTLNKIGEIGGPHCCKRNFYLAIIEAVYFTKEKLGIAMELENISCFRLMMNNQCVNIRWTFKKMIISL